MMAVENDNDPRRDILNATLRTIAEYKISGTRMKHVARKVGMSQGNLHYHFPTKTDLFVALLDMMLETFASERVDELQDPTLPPEFKLKCIFEQKKRFLRSRREFMDVYYDFWVQATVDPVIQEKMKEQYAIWRRDIQAVVQEAIASGQFAPHCERLIPSLMVSLMEGAALQFLIDAEALELDEYFDAALRMVSLFARPDEKPEADRG